MASVLLRVPDTNCKDDNENGKEDAQTRRISAEEHDGSVAKKIKLGDDDDGNSSNAAISGGQIRESPRPTGDDLNDTGPRTDSNIVKPQDYKVPLGDTDTNEFPQSNEQRSDRVTPKVAISTTEDQTRAFLDLLGTDPNNFQPKLISMAADAQLEEKKEAALVASMSQSERKRYREKKRRSDITNAIDSLTKVLLKVEPTSLMQQNNLVYSTVTRRDSSFPAQRSGRTSGMASQQPLNRTEIIGHAISALERLFVENEERKLQIMNLNNMLYQITAGGAMMPQMMQQQQQQIQQQQQQQQMMGVPNSNAPPSYPGGGNNNRNVSMMNPPSMQQHHHHHPSFAPPSSFQQGPGGGPREINHNNAGPPGGGAGDDTSGTALGDKMYYPQRLMEQQQRKQEQDEGGSNK